MFYSVLKVNYIKYKTLSIKIQSMKTQQFKKPSDTKHTTTSVKALRETSQAELSHLETSQADTRNFASQADTSNSASQAETRNSEIRNFASQAELSHLETSNFTSHTNKTLILFDSQPNPKEYDVYLKLLHASAADFLLIYNIVFAFICKHDRIITGGMGIDFALRARGALLYKSLDTDYDFYSANHAADAYRLMDDVIAFTKKRNPLELQLLSAIQAMHPRTMSVRYRFKGMADIGYVPRVFYDKLPTLSHGSFRSIHPCYQVIDQHIVFAEPFEGAPMENITSRWSKDLTRFMLLANYYDIGADMVDIVSKRADSSPYTADSSPYTANTPDKFKCVFADYPGQCIAGFAAAEYWLAKFAGKDISMCDVSRVAIISTTPHQFVTQSDATDVKYFNTILCKLPRRIECDIKDVKHEVYDIIGRRIAVWPLDSDHMQDFLLKKHATQHPADKFVKITASEATQIRAESADTIVYMCGLQYTMVYLAVFALLYDDKEAADYYSKLYKYMIDGLNNKTSRDLIFTLHKEKFTLYGTCSIPDYRLLGYRKFCAFVTHSLHPQLNMPKNYYPSDGRAPNYSYDPTKCPEFQIDGAQCETFEPADVPRECKKLFSKLEDL